MTDIYSNVRASLVKFCVLFAQEMKDAGIAQPLFFNFDAHSQENQLPDADLIGLQGYAMDLTSPPTVSVMIGVSTMDDVNLDRLEAMTGKLVNRVLPGTMIPVLDAKTGKLLPVMKVMDGGSVSPAVRAEQRPLKFVALQLGVASELG